MKGDRRASITPLRIWHLPLLHYWRRNTVPREALGNPDMGWAGLLNWYFTTHRRSIAAGLIRLYDVPVGYVAVTAKGDLGIYIGEEDARGAGVGTTAIVRTLESIGRRLNIVTCGTTMPGYFARFGFEASGTPLLDRGVWRTPMRLKLRWLEREP